MYKSFKKMPKAFFLKSAGPLVGHQAVKGGLLSCHLAILAMAVLGILAIPVILAILAIWLSC